MKTFVAAILLAVPLLADFNYESKTTFTGGSLLPALSEKQPLDKPLVATHMIKGNRMTTLTKTRSTVVDLGSQTILEINYPKKTYSLMTFAQMKELLDRAMKSRKNADPAVYKIDSRPSGGAKAFGFFNAREWIVTMNLDSVPKAAPQTAARVLVDIWRFTMPGFSEAEDFRMKLAEKLSPAYASGLSSFGILEPEILPALEEFGKLSSPGDDMPVQTTIRIGSSFSSDLAPVAQSPASQKGVVSGTISRIGSLTRKKAPAEDPDTIYPGLLLELTTELSNFGSGPADESKFNVPEGFKQK